jgi:putative transposase
MQAERAKHLNAGQYDRTEDRKGHTNGYKPKTLRTRVGEITFAVSHVREGSFYPSALEKGLRSEPRIVMGDIEVLMAVAR